MQTASIPDWVGETVLGAIFATLGFLLKMLLDYFKARRQEQRGLTARLEELSAPLNESRTLFFDQNFKARRLLQLLQERLPGQVSDVLGFDELFFRLYANFTNEEREIHALIRATTMNSMYRVNTRMHTWLVQNASLRQTQQSDAKISALAKQLDLLQAHLNLWDDKYNATVAKDERRCLVYLADEKGHGLRFPQELEPLLADVLHSRH
jgi:hypothetical protein